MSRFSLFLLFLILLPVLSWAQKPGFVYTSKILSVEHPGAASSGQSQGPNLEAIRASGMKVQGNVFQVIPNVGVLFHGVALIPGDVVQSVSDPSLLHPGQERQIVVKGENAVPIGSGAGDIILVVCPTDKLCDGSPVSGMIYPCGTYSYTNTADAIRTVLRYAPSAEEAYKILASGQ